MFRLTRLEYEVLLSVLGQVEAELLTVVVDDANDDIDEDGEEDVLEEELDKEVEVVLRPELEELLILLMVLLFIVETKYAAPPAIAMIMITTTTVTILEIPIETSLLRNSCGIKLGFVS